MTIFEDAEKLKEKMITDQKVKLKIALFGQPGAGKSSIINRLVGSIVAKVGQQTDVTVEAQVIDWANLLLVDLPGYDTSKFPKNEFFETFNIEDFNMYLCVFSGKLRDADTEFFKKIKKLGKACLFVRNRHDEIWEEGIEISVLEQTIVDDVKRQLKSDETVIFTSCRNKNGFDTLSKSIYELIEDTYKEKWLKSAKAYSKEFLDLKKEACEKQVYKYSALSAANGLNPIPGADIAVDVSIIIKLFKEIRDSYGVGNEDMQIKQTLMPQISSLANKILNFGTKKGVLLLLETYAKQETVKIASKYIPLVGQAIASTLGFAITKTAGMSYLDDCHNVAEAILQKELT